MKSFRRKAMALVILGAAMSASTAAAQGRLLVIEEEVIRGEIDKPEAFYILSPSNLDYEAMPPEDSFLDELYETVEEEPF